MFALIQKCHLFFSLVVAFEDDTLSGSGLLFSSRKSFYHRLIDGDTVNMATLSPSSALRLTMRTMGFDANLAANDVTKEKQETLPLFPDIFRVADGTTFGLITLNGFASNTLDKILKSIKEENGDCFLQLFGSKGENYDQLSTTALYAVEKKKGFACSSTGSLRVCQEKDSLDSEESQHYADISDQVEEKNINTQTKLLRDLKTLLLLTSKSQGKRFYAIQLDSPANSDDVEFADTVAKHFAIFVRNIMARNDLHSFQIIVTSKGATTAKKSLTAFERRELLAFTDITDGSDEGTVSKQTNRTQSTVSMNDIAQYQIILWTAILLGATLLLSVVAMSSLGSNHDSLLHAKFITNTNQRRLD